MKPRSFIAVLVAASLIVPGSAAAVAVRGQAAARSLTVYPSGGALVRETRILPLARGMNRVQLEGLPSSVNTQSLVVLTPGVVVAGNRGLTVSQPAGGGASSATLALDLHATQPASELRLAYLTEGFMWSASYTVVVMPDDRSVELTGLATLLNRSGVELRDAEVQLLAGHVYRVRRRDIPFAGRMETAEVRAAEADLGIAPGMAGDYHLYTLPERIDLATGQDRAVRLFGGAGLAAQRRYVLRQGVNPLSRGGEWPQESVEVAYRVRRPAGEGLGDLPIPAGVVRVYRPDADGRLQLLGETAVGNTPKEEDLWLPVGRAFELTAQRTQTDYQVRGRNRIESAWRIVLRNRTKKPATVEVVETVRGDWRILSATHKHERRSATIFAFEVEVPADGETTLEYVIEVQT